MLRGHGDAQAALQPRGRQRRRLQGHDVQHLGGPDDLGLRLEAGLLVLAHRRRGRRERVAHRRVDQHARRAGVGRRRRAAERPARHGAERQQDGDDHQVVAHGSRGRRAAVRGCVVSLHGELPRDGRCRARGPTWTGVVGVWVPVGSRGRIRSRPAPRRQPQTRPSIRPEMIGTSALECSGRVGVGGGAHHLGGSPAGLLELLEAGLQLLDLGERLVRPGDDQASGPLPGQHLLLVGDVQAELAQLVVLERAERDAAYVDERRHGGVGGPARTARRCAPTRSGGGRGCWGRRSPTGGSRPPAGRCPARRRSRPAPRGCAAAGRRCRC